MALKFLNNGYFAGKVGIGTNSPTSKLDIRQSTSGGSDVLGIGAITIGSDNPYWTIRGTATSLQDLAFDRRYAGVWVESMRIERSSGNVGIGTGNPLAKFAILTSGTFVLNSNGNDYSGVNIQMKTTNTAVNAIGSGIVWNKGASSRKVAAITNYIYGDADQSGLNFYVQPTSSGSSAVLTEAMRITNTGGISFGTTGTAYGTSGQILKSNGNASPTWIDGSAIPGVPGGSGTLNTIPLWTPDGDTLGNSIITQPTSAEVIVGGKLKVDSTAAGYSSTKIQTGGFGDSQSGINILNSTTGYGYILFGDGSGADLYRGQIAYKHGDDYMAFNTAGSEEMRIDSSGRLLINATSTAFSDKFYINSDAYATGGWRVGTAATYVGKLINDGGKLTLMSDGSRDVQIGNNGNPAMLYVDTSAANVGIGTTSPNGKLEVNGIVKIGNVTTGLSMNGSSATEFLISGADTSGNAWNSIHIKADGNDGLFIEKDTNNVGIGTTSPDSTLHVLGPNAASGGITLSSSDSNNTQKVGRIKTSHYSNSEEPFTAILTNAQTSNNVLRLGGGSGGENAATEILFYTAANNTTLTGSERMRIGSNGNVGIGTTSPSQRTVISGPSTNPLLNTTVPSSATLLLSNSDTAYGTYFCSLGTGTGLIQQRRQTSAVYYDLAINPYGGNVGIGTTSPGKKLEVESSTTPLHLNRTGGATALIGLDIDGTTRGLLGATTTAAFVSYSTTPAPLVTVANAGGVQFNTYSAGTLVTDASGNITVSSGGGAGGPYLPLAGGTMTGVTQFNDHTQHGDQVQARWGASNDFTIEHNATDSSITNITGDLYITNKADDKDIVFRSDDGSGGFTTYFKLDGSAVNVRIDKPFLFTDNVKAEFGSSQDLQIYHDSSDNNSYIKELGSGSLQIWAKDFEVYNAGGTETLINADVNAGVQLYFNNSPKIATTSTGITVSGDIKIQAALLSNQENTDVDTGTETVASVAIATYTAAFFDFVIKKTTNVRSGTVYACHDGTNVEFTETSTQDLGDTSDVTLSVDISGGSMRLRATTTSDNWSVKSLIRAI